VNLTEEATCPREGCGRPLPEERRKTQKFCCPTCAQAAANDRRRAPKLPDRACIFCEGPFPPSKRNNDYCSSRCAEMHYVERRRQERQKRSDGIFGDRPHTIIRDIQDVREGEFALYLFDEHGEFYDEELCSAVDKVIADFQPDRLFYGGDWGLDFYDISVFKKNPLKLTDPQDDADHARARMDYHAVIAPNMKRYYAGGNHEARWLRWLWDHPEIAKIRDPVTDQLLSIEWLLGLEERRVEYLDYPGRYRYNGFIVTHGPGDKRGGLQVKMAAKWMAEHLHASGVCGHFHRYQVYGFNDELGIPQTFYAIGCLCRLDPDYDPYPEWQQGFGYSRIINGKVHFTPVNVFDRSFQVEGRTYRY